MILKLVFQFLPYFTVQLWPNFIQLYPPKKVPALQPNCYNTPGLAAAGRSQCGKYKIDRDWTMSTFRLRFCAAALHAQHSCRQDVTILGSKPAVKSIKVCVLGMTENCTEPNISKVLTRHPTSRRRALMTRRYLREGNSYKPANIKPKVKLVRK